MTDADLSRPLVSIVTPTLNQGRYIEATIRSVLAQEYPAVEYIVMDGGSTDGTLDILRRYEDRLTWVSGPDAGQSDAIQRGFQRSRGSILAWLCSDDLYRPEAVSEAVASMTANPGVGLVYGLAGYVDESGAPTGPCSWIEPFDLAHLIEDKDYICQPAAFFDRATYMRVGGVDLRLHYVMDWDLWIRLGRAAGAMHVPRMWAQVRDYPDTKTRTGGLDRLEEIERYIGPYGRGPIPSDYVVEKLRHHYQAGRSALLDGHPHRMLRHWSRVPRYLASPIGRRAAAARLRRELHAVRVALRSLP